MASVVVGVLAGVWGEGLLLVAEDVTGTPLWHLTVYAVQCPPSLSECTRTLSASAQTCLGPSMQHSCKQANNAAQ
ncbi:hypothetical protein ABBQ38_008021 [Trebouxia sp. C0009 RCD-2024]